MAFNPVGLRPNIEQARDSKLSAKFDNVNKIS